MGSDCSSSWSLLIFLLSYILQGNRAVFNQYQEDPTCKLCSAAPETRQHFLAECPVFESERDSFKQKM